MADRKFEEQVKELRNAIELFGKNEANLDNFQRYLEIHFDTWMQKFAHDPDGLANEMKHFAEMEI